MKQSVLLFFVALSMAGTAWAQQAEPTHNLPPGAPPAPAGLSQIAITPNEWQELRAARSAAIQANPDLVAADKKLRERMRAFEDKVDAAMFKANPSIAPLIAKFEAGRQRPGMPAGSPSPASPAVK
jgi:hypothetical protein